MKFICDNCKAKYQIGDEKVAGKMVRMQCRRCGHLIQVSASVTESSVARALPVEPPREAGDDAHVAPPSDEAPAANGGAASPLKPPLASSLGHGAAPAPPRPASQALPRPAGAPRPPVAPRAVPGPASSPRPATAPQASPAARAVQPAPAAPARSPAPAARAAEPTPPAGAAGAFTRAMSNDRPLGKAPAVRTTASEDWYVGVGGVPLGPVRLSVIRDKALAGAVDGESLVWREGFDEWLPLKNFPELLEIVTQAQSTRLSPPARRISTTGSSVGQPQASPSAKAPSSSRGPALAGAVPARPATREPEPPGLNEQAPAVAAFTAAGTPAVSAPLPVPVASAASVTSVASVARVTPVAPAASAPAAWPGAPAGAGRTHAAGAAPVEVLTDPFAADRTAPVAFAPGPELAASASTELARGAGGLAAGGSPSAAAPAGGLAAGVARSATAPAGGSLTAGGSPAAPAGALSAAEPAPLVGTPGSLVETVAPRRRSGMSPLAYAFIAMAAAFGGVSAFVLLSPKPQPVQVVTAAPPQSQPADLPTAAPPPPPPVEPDAPAPAETASARPEVASTGKAGGVASQRPPPDKPVAPSASAQLDRSGFGAGVPGPSSGPGSQGTSAALTPLSQGEISGVVESNRPSVRRHCWQPALDARASNAASTARVSASVVIAASGAVQSVSAGGSEKDYPGLSSCIASRIKSWRFPPSSGSTPVTIPFVFAAQ
ncbi:GYF domain-containing protein [Sorangium sp. So ce448]|uniref:GYF domain-containing protein n=1 Tax=Sorangium sp. So ce448 TaxID=3133314 RepID=UPI003F6327BC